LPISAIASASNNRSGASPSFRTSSQFGPSEPDRPEICPAYHSGLELSRSGEEAWNRRSEETIARIREAGVARVIDLSEDEVAAFGAVLLPITERLVSEMGAQAVFSAMRGE